MHGSGPAAGGARDRGHPARTFRMPGALASRRCAPARNGLRCAHRTIRRNGSPPHGRRRTEKRLGEKRHSRHARGLRPPRGKLRPPRGKGPDQGRSREFRAPDYPRLVGTGRRHRRKRRRASEVSRITAALYPAEGGAWVRGRPRPHVCAKRGGAREWRSLRPARRRSRLLRRAGETRGRPGPAFGGVANGRGCAAARIGLHYAP